MQLGKLPSSPQNRQTSQTCCDPGRAQRRLSSVPYIPVPLHDISTLEGLSILAHDTTVLVSRFLLAHTAQSALETPAGDDKTKGGLAPQRGVLGSSGDDTAPTTNTRYL